MRSHYALIGLLERGSKVVEPEADTVAEDDDILLAKPDATYPVPSMVPALPELSTPSPSKYKQAQSRTRTCWTKEYRNKLPEKFLPPLRKCNGASDSWTTVQNPLHEGKGKLPQIRSTYFISGMQVPHMNKWLKRRGLTQVPRLSKVDRERYQRMFEVLDVDHSGTITATELTLAFETLGLDFDRKELHKLLQQVDTNHSGEIDVEEFVYVMKHSNLNGATGTIACFPLLAQSVALHRLIYLFKESRKAAEIDFMKDELHFRQTEDSPRLFFF
jgi:hypothetical protein